MLLKQPYIGPKSIIFEVISVLISVIPVISVNRRTASHVRMGLRKCVMTPWRHEYLMSSKTGNSANVF